MNPESDFRIESTYDRQAVSYTHLDVYKRQELTQTILLDILNTTGITAAAGMGSNLYRCV